MIRKVNSSVLDICVKTILKGYEQDKLIYLNKPKNVKTNKQKLRDIISGIRDSFYTLTWTWSFLVVH